VKTVSFVIKKKIGNYTYIYEVTSYRDSNGEPRNKQVPIGKIDAQGQEQYKPEYIERMIEAGTPLDIRGQTLFSEQEIKESVIKEYGAYYFIESIACTIGLTKILESAFPKHWKEILVLAIYLVCTEDPFMYCCHWLESTQTIPVGILSSQRISEILATLSAHGRTTFFTEWATYRKEKEYLALDITSVSSWSELIDDVAYGYNRDHDDLPQVNICMLMGEKSLLPVFQIVYEGSIRDVSTLITTVKSAFGYDKTGRLDKLLVMDKGFFKITNVNDLLSEPGVRFIIPVSFTANFAKSQVKSEKKDIDSLKNTIPCGSGSVRGVTKPRVWNGSGGKKLYTHIVFNAMKAFKAKDDLYTHTTRLKEIAMEDPDNKEYQADIEKYLIIRSSSTAANGKTVNICEDVIEAELKTAGWLVLVSNDVNDCRRALEIYRAKDVVEKGFLRLKNSIDLGRLRVHSQNSMQNKVFVGFLSLIMLSHIHKVMAEKDLYKDMTMKELLMILRKLRIQYINNIRILFPVSKAQKHIFESFSIPLPE
jgi:transposase